MNKLARRSRRHVVPAALLGAVIVASAGTGAVADQLIGSRDVADDSLRSVDVKDSTIRSRDVRNESIRGTDVRDGSLKAADFGGAFQGEQGPPGVPGPQGEPGPAGEGPQAEVFTYTGAFTTVEEDFGASFFDAISTMQIPAEKIVGAQRLEVIDSTCRVGLRAGLARGTDDGNVEATLGNVGGDRQLLSEVRTGTVPGNIYIGVSSFGPEPECTGTFSFEFTVEDYAGGPGAPFS